jgi:hypothetical protein
MVFVGIVITFLGFLLAMFSVGLTSSTGSRLILVLLGLAISLAGIIGVINPAYLKTAIWKK